MAHKVPANHNAIIQHQLADRCQVACCDRKIALFGYPMDGNVPPAIALNRQRLEQVDPRELIQGHVAYIFDDRASQKGVDRATVIFRFQELLS